MPRRLAYKVLRKLSENKQYSNIAIDSALSTSRLSGADRSLATAIVMGAVERRITLDYFIKKLAKAPDKIDSETSALLHMGLYQLAFMDKIPEYAAVNETVSLAPRRSAGFINAILRSFLRKKESLFAEMPEHIKMSCPEELYLKFTDIYGPERTKNIFEYFNRPPRLTLRVNTLKISADELCKKLSDGGYLCERSPYVADALLVEGASPTELYGFSEGAFFVQDVASQICVEALGAEEWDTVIDTCSCPGSKSFGCAVRMKNRGKIYSFDLHKSKLSLVEDSAARLGIDVIETAERDGRVFVPSLEESADRVLCDVPCSGLGVIAKKPEIRYKNVSDFENLPEIQLAILENSSRYVKRGGILVYSTCTVLCAENSDNVKKFLAAHPEFEACDFTVGPLYSEDGMLSLSPDIHGTDGFFVAKFKKL